jgi:hypothetical protein
MHHWTTSTNVRISVTPQARRGNHTVFGRQKIVSLGEGGKQPARGLGFDFTAQRGIACLERE